ncbi:MAG: hypothetical protein AAB445_01715 [Patescibacteria group bacterium]
MKYGKYSLGHIEALLNKLGGEEVVDGILEGTKQADIRDVIRFLFDRTGRCIPYDLTSSVTDANRSFKLVQPEVNLADRLHRLVSLFPQGTAFCSVEEFEQEIAALRALIEANPRFKNCFNGVWLPLVLPQTEAGDYGTLLESRFLTAVKSSYLMKFPKRSFKNYHKGELAGQVSIVHQSHERLMAKMQERPVIGILLANPLQGFSIPACREYADSLPEILHLSGGYDFLTAIAAYPDVLGRDHYTPGNDMAAVQCQSVDYSLRCRVFDDGQLGFASWDHYAYDNYSGGLFFAR